MLEKKIICNNLKFFICLSLKKNFGTLSVFFYANKIKFCSIICSTFKQKEKAPKKEFELKFGKKKIVTLQAHPREKKPNINPKQN